MASDNRDSNHVPALVVSSVADYTTPLKPTGRTLTSSKPIDVAINDGQGNQITAFAAVTTTPVFGQAKIASSGTAVQLSSGTLTNGVIITAKTTNTANITIGGSGVTNTVDGTGNGYILAPGAAVSFAVDNVNRLYINGTTGDIISYGGS